MKREQVRRTPGIRLRPMEEADLGQVVALERAAFAKPWPREQFVRELTLPFSRSVVACRPDARRVVLGYSVRWLVAGEIELLNLAVVRKQRMRGIGRILVRSLLSEALRERASLVGLEVSIHNRKARKLYESLGFIAVRQRRNYYAAGDHAVVMEWRPDPESRPGIRLTRRSTSP